MTNSDPRLGLKDPYYVDIENTYILAFIIYGLFAIPNNAVMGFAILFLIVFGFMIYNRRRKLRLSDHQSPLKMIHINLFITQFWRFILLSILPVIASSVIVGQFADSSNIDEMYERHDALGTKPDLDELAESIYNYQIVNETLIFWTNLLCFLPLLFYILYMHFRGFRAYKKGEEIDPKSWRPA